MVILFQPIFMDKVWGGSSLKKLYGYNCSTNCGEAWGISAHKNGSSVIMNSPYEGMTLSELYENNKELFGNYNKEFPILVKLISAEADLSIQVHPDDTLAKKYNSLGKDECWYILDTKDSANILIGHHAKSLEEIKQFISRNEIEKIINKYSINKGDFFYIKAGTIHAICEGTTLLEVQQSSDITFRLYDYNRLDNGALRELHVDEGLQAISIPNNELVQTPIDDFFDFSIHTVEEEQQFNAAVHGDYIFILNGNGYFNDVQVKAGDFLMVTSKEIYTVKGNIRFQITRF